MGSQAVGESRSGVGGEWRTYPPNRILVLPGVCIYIVHANVGLICACLLPIHDHQQVRGRQTRRSYQKQEQLAVANPYVGHAHPHITHVGTAAKYVHQLTNGLGISYLRICSHPQDPIHSHYVPGLVFGLFRLKPSQMKYRHLGWLEYCSGISTLAKVLNDF